jgi:hypothetical protein
MAILIGQNKELIIGRIDLIIKQKKMYEDLKKINIEIETSKGATDDIIEKYEQELSVKFGKEYKAFLKEFGTLSVEYLEFYGIIGENSSVPSAIHATKFARKNIENFPVNLVVFLDVGDGSFYCVDNKDKVYLCNYNNCKFVDETFKDFLFKQVNSLVNG